MKTRSVFLVAALLIPSAADAADHVMRVNEVLLDGGGGEQYIELHDANPESLPAPPYTLKIYNSSGTMTETVTLTGITAGAGVYYLVGNTAADTTYTTAVFDAALTMALPNPGQACFENGSNTKLHCVAWGCGQTMLTATTSHAGMVPSSTMSLSLPTAGGPLQFATPTPDAANSSGTAGGCPAVAVDASVIDAPGGGGGSNNPDAGTGGGGGGGGDDDSGCCQSSTPASTTGAALLSMLVLGAIVRRRRRSTT